MSVEKRLVKFAYGSVITVAIVFGADVVINKTNEDSKQVNFDDCIYEINYPDGNGSTIKRQSKGYAETYFINGENQHKYYFIPLDETDTIFFVGDNQSWNMKRVSCN